MLSSLEVSVRNLRHSAAQLNEASMKRWRKLRNAAAWRLNLALNDGNMKFGQEKKILARRRGDQASQDSNASPKLDDSCKTPTFVRGAQETVGSRKFTPGQSLLSQQPFGKPLATDDQRSLVSSHTRRGTYSSSHANARSGQVSSRTPASRRESSDSDGDEVVRKVTTPRRLSIGQRTHSPTSSIRTPVRPALTSEPKSPAAALLVKALKQKGRLPSASLENKGKSASLENKGKSPGKADERHPVNQVGQNILEATDFRRDKNKNGGARLPARPRAGDKRITTSIEKRSGPGKIHEKQGILSANKSALKTPKDNDPTRPVGKAATEDLFDDFM